MNERIQELALQADEYARDQSILYETWKEIYSEKFAELIVRECINTLPEQTEPIADTAKRIKQHFGIK